jgi:histidyl-tRNA synthetase
MECLTHKSEIEATFTSVSDYSYNEKRSPFMDQERMDTFLDTILDFKDSLKEKTDTIISLTDRVDNITWYNELDDECLKLINDLISAIKDLRSTLTRQYASMSFLRKKGIAKEEIKEFKSAIDEVKESYQDLESIFFFLPEIPDFKETTKLLSLI